MHICICMLQSLHYCHMMCGESPSLPFGPCTFAWQRGMCFENTKGVAWYGTGYKAPRLVVLRSFTLYTRCLLGCRSRGFVLCQQAAASGLSDSATLTIFSGGDCHQQEHVSRQLPCTSQACSPHEHLCDTIGSQRHCDNRPFCVFRASCAKVSSNILHVTFTGTEAGSGFG